MSKTKLLGTVITTAIAMTGICTEISNNVIPEANTSIEAKTETKDIESDVPKGK